MDAASVNKRKSRIARRINELTIDKPGIADDLEKFLRSEYHWNALNGAHPFLLPASSHDDLRERKEYFRDSQVDVLKEFGERISPSQTANQRWYEKSDVRIGIIADEFLYKSFESSAHLIQITPSNYEQMGDQIDLFLVTSTWRGVRGEWDGAAQKASSKRKLIEDTVIPFFQGRGVPTAFYSKEDPPNYQAFVSLAMRCDFIFTSAVEMLPKYMADCPRAKEFGVLPFSIDFLHHNPVGSRRDRISDVVFAGSWHNHKYQERRLAAETIFDGVIESDRNLRIIDRNSFLGNPRYEYPEQYLPYIEDAVPHEFLMNLHRQSDIVINLNSVVSSSTMYANRVVELQAMGSTVISNYNAGINDQFPNVFMPESKQDVIDFLKSMTEKDLYFNQMHGLRNVYRHHVNFDRVRYLLNMVGLPQSTVGRSIGIIAENERFAADFISTQDCEVPVKFFRSEDEAKASGVDLHGYISEEKRYGRNYLQDLINATKYVGSTTISKATDSDHPSEHHSYSKNAGARDLSLSWSAETPIVQAHDYYTIDNLEVHGVNSTPYNVVSNPNRFELSVIVPVYNNGQHLRFKCFESLRRSSIFEQMEIVLVDDGSTDVETRQVVRDLDAEYSNVVVHLNPLGGSGSASRPRNQGLEIASASWVTYLDPDNEATCDGFAQLLQKAKASDAHFAIGNMVRNSDRRKLVNNCRILRKHLMPASNENDVYSVPSNMLRKINFAPMSIQALVAKTSWLRGLGITQPEGAVGQDSYFFQQMLHYADRIVLHNSPIHIYYAAVSNSTVNTIGSKFYRKYLPLEKSRSQWLRETGLLDDYNSRRLEPFVKGWYLEKLSRVAEDEREDAIRTIREIVGMYGKTNWKDEELSKFFS